VRGTCVRVLRARHKRACKGRATLLRTIQQGWRMHAKCGSAGYLLTAAGSAARTQRRGACEGAGSARASLAAVWQPEACGARCRCAAPRGACSHQQRGTNACARSAQPKCVEKACAVVTRACREVPAVRASLYASSRLSVSGTQELRSSCLRQASAMPEPMASHVASYVRGAPGCQAPCARVQRSRVVNKASMPPPTP